MSVSVSRLIFFAWGSTAAFHGWASSGQRSTLLAQWGYSSISPSSACESILQCWSLRRALSESRAHRRRCPMTIYHIFSYIPLICSTPRGRCRGASRPWSWRGLRWPVSSRRSCLPACKPPSWSWRCSLAWCRGGWYCACGDIQGLNKLADTLGKLQQDIPNHCFGDLPFLLFCTLDDPRQVTLGGVLHEQVKIVLIAVEHSWHKFDDVLMVETC